MAAFTQIVDSTAIIREDTVLKLAVVASILFRTKSIGAVWLKTVMTVQLIKGCRTIFDLR